MALGGSALLVCGERRSREVYTHSLQDEGLVVHEADRLDSALRLFANQRPHVVVLRIDSDLSQDIEKAGLFAELDPAVPIIVAIGDEEEPVRVEVHTRGDVEHVPGQLAPPGMVAKLAALNAARTIGGQLRSENERLRYEANVDQLTGVYNRRFLLERLDYELARSSRYSAEFSLLMLDLDNFKRLNDEYGHDTGDGVLIEVASYLTEGVRQVDTVARYGGDEFVILLVQATPSAAVLVGERLRQGLETLRPRALGGGGPPPPLTASVGCCGYLGQTTRDGRQIISCADQALYAAKHAGGNRVEVFAGPN